MNYVIIANSNTPSTEVPPNVSQTFTDEELILLGKMAVELKANYIQQDLNIWNTASASFIHDYNKRTDASLDFENKNNALATLIQLLRQWEFKTQ